MAELQEFIDNFDLLDDWDSRYQYLVDLGERMTALAEEQRCDERKVRGCMSNVWTRAEPDPDRPERVVFSGYCDTAIINGVLAMLVAIASGRTRAEIDKLDVDEIFTQLKLDEHLSPNRHVGVFAIVEQMKRQAAAIEQGNIKTDNLRAVT
jgi:cysteine desulfuration protein SufE